MAERTIRQEATPHVNPQRELWALYGDATKHLLQHYETVSPRHEDIDLSYNAVERDSIDSATTLRNNDTFTAVNNTPKTFIFKARRGYVAHVNRIVVYSANPSQSLASVAVTVEFMGRRIQRTQDLTYKRPVMLDRDDTIAIVVSNTSGGDLPLVYRIEGWLRAVESNDGRIRRGDTAP